MATMASLWRGYTRVLNAHPFKTQVASTCGLMCFADIMAQQVVERRGWKGHDIKRTFRQSLIGLVFVGPALTMWYRTVDRLFKGAPQITIFKKVAADQFLFAPPFIASFFVVNGITTMTEPKKIKKLLQKNYMPTLLTNYKIWPAVQMVNFYVVPLYYRVLVAQIVAIFWNTYLIWQVHDHPLDEEEEELKKVVTVTVVAD